MSQEKTAPLTAMVLYEADDGATRLDVRLQDRTVWLTQKNMAELYQVRVPTINEHLKNIFREGELSESAVVRQFLITASDGKSYLTNHYSLATVLSVGYRVRSTRGTQFRQWATSILGEYLVKGFAMDDQRLKEPQWDYFDELLERIRDIRASEKRFYQKVKDLFALSQDYQEKEEEVSRFFAEVQNKMLFAVTGHTAAELVMKRADPSQPNMNLKSWQGSRVRKADVIVGKNYLDAEEIEQLNRIVNMYLDYAEDRVKMKKTLTLTDWRDYVDKFILFNERPLLDGKGKMSRKSMVATAHKRYDEFDAKRKAQEAMEADAEDIKELEELERELSGKDGGEDGHHHVKVLQLVVVFQELGVADGVAPLNAVVVLAVQEHVHFGQGPGGAYGLLAVEGVFLGTLVFGLHPPAALHQK